MKIQCFVSQGCASREALEANIREALRLEGMEAQVSLSVLSEEEAKRMGIPGSPTVLVEGKDLEGLRPLEGTVS